ncbi:hypothetical protein SAMN05421844_10456 [Bosea robiniae]|uniref:Uncharacterized protein n=2 Tax=Bosea robiniae TaxID=1036780 RepID=A0ABY0NZ78_9HYPH|nr:hypothetical protein SAMN05421844_10456 [Bosea robiniae]
MSYPPANPPMKYSLLAGKEVSTWSDLWKHECEVMMLAGQPLAKRNEIFDEPGKGMKFKRGDAAVAHLRLEVERYAALKRAAGG